MFKPDCCEHRRQPKHHVLQFSCIFFGVLFPDSIPFTLFAPTNAAFNALPDEVLVSSLLCQHDYVYLLKSIVLANSLLCQHDMSTSSSPVSSPVHFFANTTWWVHFFVNTTGLMLWWAVFFVKARSWWVDSFVSKTRLPIKAWCPWWVHFFANMTGLPIKA